MGESKGMQKELQICKSEANSSNNPDVEVWWQCFPTGVQS